MTNQHAALTPTALDPPGPTLKLLGSRRLLGPAPAALTAKAWMLLAYLAVSRAPQPRMHLYTLLWPNSNLKAAQKNLSNALWEIRQALGRDPFAGTALITLRADLAVDVWMLDSASAAFAAEPALDAAALERAEASLALYDGPLLKGLAAHDSPEFDFWLTENQRALELRCIDFLTRIQTAYEQAGDTASVLRTGQRLLQLDPFNESAVQAMLRGHVRLGQRAEALRCYERFAQRLHQELGLEPDPATRELKRTLLRKLPAGPGAAPQPPDQALAQALNPLFGRDAELGWVSQRIDQGARLLTVVGPGGIGKTRFIIAATHLLADRYEQVCSVACDVITDSALLIPTLLHALKAPVSADESGEELLIGALQSRRTLLVLDNIEQIIAEVAPLAHRLVSQIPTLTILASSRERLSVSAEVALTLQPLPFPPLKPDLAPDELRTFPAVRWLVNRLEASAEKAHFSAAEWAGLQAICARLEGVPLALELAAGWGATLPVAAIVARLDHPLPLLQGTFHDRPAHQNSMVATLDWGYALLSEREQQLCQMLTVFADGWTLESGEALFGPYGWSPTDLLVTLRALISKNWIFSPVADAGGRFRMLIVIREYLQQRAADLPATLHERVAVYWLDWVERAYAEFYTPRQEDWLRRFKHEHNNLLAALQWLHAAGRSAELVRLTLACVPYWRDHGQALLAQTWLRRSDALAGQLDDRTAMQFREGYSVILRSLGDYAGARQQCERGLAHAGPEPSTQAARLWAALGWLLRHLSSLEEAHAAMQQALALANACGDRPTQIDVLNSMARIANQRGEYDRSLALYHQALAWCQSLDLRRMQVSILLNLGSLYAEQEDFDQAEQSWQAAWQLAVDLDIQDTQLTILVCQSYVAYWKRDFARVRRLIDHIEALALAAADQRMIATCCFFHADLDLEERHDAATAVLNYKQALAIFTAPSMLTDILDGLVRCAVHQRRWPIAAVRVAATSKLITDRGVVWPRPEQRRHERLLHTIQSSLSPEEWAECWAEGAGLDIAGMYALVEAAD